MRKYSTAVDEMIATKRFQMFNPTSKGDLRMDYPELWKIESFAALNPKKMLFVWWYAARWSPTMNITDEKDRIAYSLYRAYGSKLPKDIEEPYLKKNWGDEIAKAIADMRGFEPMPRVIMKLTCMDLMDKVKRLLGQAAPEEGENGIEWSDVKEYFQAVKLGMEVQNNLLPFTEHSAFGITQVESTEEEEEGEIIEFYHNNRNN